MGRLAHLQKGRLFSNRGPQATSQRQRQRLWLRQARQSAESEPLMVVLSSKLQLDNS